MGKFKIETFKDRCKGGELYTDETVYNDAMLVGHVIETTKCEELKELLEVISCCLGAGCIKFRKNWLKALLKTIFIYFKPEGLDTCTVECDWNMKKEEN
jgi:hypothetical protein